MRQIYFLLIYISDKHKRIKHLGIKHTCNLCDFTTAYQRNLTIHFQTKNVKNVFLYFVDVCSLSMSFFCHSFFYLKREDFDIRKKNFVAFLL